MKFIYLIAACSALVGCQPQSNTGRFTLNVRSEALVLLDTTTGRVWVNTIKSDGWVAVQSTEGGPR